MLNFCGVMGISAVNLTIWAKRRVLIECTAWVSAIPQSLVLESRKTDPGSLVERMLLTVDTWSRVLNFIKSTIEGYFDLDQPYYEGFFFSTSDRL